MIITLYGYDTYRRKKKIKELIDGYSKKNNNLSFEVIDADDDGAINRFEVFLAATSLFQDNKLVLLKNGISRLNHAALKNILKKNDKKEKTVIIISDEAEKIPKTLQILNEKPNLTQEFVKLDQGKFTLFIKNEADLRGIALDDKTAAYLADGFTGDSWGLILELDKLALLPGRQLSPEFFKKTGLFVESDFFSYIFGWFRKTTAQKLANIENLFFHKHDAAKIFNILAYQDQSQIGKFANYDIEIKTGRIEYEEALLELSI